MTRAVSEWVGRTDDTPPPPRVKDRIVQAQDGCCAKCAARCGSWQRAASFLAKVQP